MYDIILLGQIPGTNIQIGFMTWMYMTGLVAIGWLIYHYGNLDFSSIRNNTRTHKEPIKQRLHASQLHSRISRSAR